MQKTKLGISVGLMGAGLYFFGLISLIPGFLLAGYVLLMEENDWLKRTAVKMIVIVLGFGLLSAGVGLIQDVFLIINNILGWIPFLHFSIGVPFHLDSILSYAISFVKTIVLIILGFKALSAGSMKVGFADKLVSKHMD